MLSFREAPLPGYRTLQISESIVKAREDVEISSFMVSFSRIPSNACGRGRRMAALRLYPPPPYEYIDAGDSSHKVSAKAVGLCTCSRPLMQFSALVSRNEICACLTRLPPSPTRPLGSSQRHVSGRDDGQVGPARPAPPAMVYPGMLCHNGRWSLRGP